MEDKEKEYSITNEDIKFPTFIDKSLAESLKNQNLSKKLLHKILTKPWKN